MNTEIDVGAAQGFAIACLIGALTGLEREKHRSIERSDGSAGMRTFILVAEVGALSGWLSHVLASPWVIAAGLLAVAVVVVAGYLAAGRAGGPLGLTTEVATLVVCLLGAMTTTGQAPLAIGLAVVTAAVLAYKEPLHELARRLGWNDVYAGLRLLIAAFVVLPLLPDHAVDPWGALNPASLWRLVLLISGLSLIGYIGTRWLGERGGSAITGLTGGLVSSTAVTLAFSRLSRDGARQASALAGGILLAWGVMFVRVVVEVFAVNPDLLGRVLPPFAAMAAVSGAGALVLIGRRGGRALAPSADVPLSNPFSLTAAIKFAAFFALVLVVVRIAQMRFAGAGLYGVAALAGLADVDAITLSMAQQARAGGDAGVALGAIVTAAVTNTLVKAGIAATLGGPGLRRPVLIATAAVIAAGAAVALWVS